jgi:hypothetical protein
MSGLGPTAEILSFAWPKESIQRKGHPDAAYSLRSSLLNGVAKRGFLPLRQRDASLHRPCGLFRSKTPVLGAAYGGPTHLRINNPIHSTVARSTKNAYHRPEENFKN